VPPVNAKTNNVDFCWTTLYQHFVLLFFHFFVFPGDTTGTLYLQVTIKLQNILQKIQFELENNSKKGHPTPYELKIN